MKKFFDSKKGALLILLIIAGLAVSFRFYGLNWDQGQHLHPDERFMTMVATSLRWPGSFVEYFNPSISPLNPYNTGFDFYVYGALPLYIAKFVAGFIKVNSYDYNNITLVGRWLSGVFDLLTLGIVFLTTRKIFNTKTALLAAFVYTVSVLPIQLSHFFAVDTFLVFFIASTFLLLTRLITNDKSPLLISLVAGCLFGLALATKVSSVLFLPIVALSYLYFAWYHKKWINGVMGGLLFVLASYMIGRFADPRIFATPNFLNFSLNPQFVANIKQLKSFDNPNALFPPAIQWIKAKPVIFPAKNMLLWGLGIPLALLSFCAFIFKAVQILKSIIKNKEVGPKQWTQILILLWVAFLFLYQGMQFAMPLRYFYPTYPFISMVTGSLIYQIGSRVAKANWSFSIIFYGVIVFILLIWPLSFSAIYSRPHSRVTASEWIYKNIPTGSTLSCEHWDDCLPLPIEHSNSNVYKTEIIEIFSPDTAAKWSRINNQLKQVDYIVLSSNRGWGTLPKVYEKYPQTTRFYRDLFTERLGYKKVAEFVSYPTIPILNIPVSDDSSDESFTVYDHPKVMIFKRME